LIQPKHLKAQCVVLVTTLTQALIMFVQLVRMDIGFQAVLQLHNTNVLLLVTGIVSKGLRVGLQLTMVFQVLSCLRFVLPGMIAQIGRCVLMVSISPLTL
jgi:hypothetical protein